MTQETFTLETMHLADSLCVVAEGDDVTSDRAKVTCAMCASLVPDNSHEHRFTFSWTDGRFETWQCAGCGRKDVRPDDVEGRRARACTGLGGVVFFSESDSRWIESPCGACGGWHSLGDEPDERVAR